MKMLCIRGRLHRAHTGLFAGRTYEVSIAKGCCGIDQALAEGSVFKRPVRLICKVCQRRWSSKENSNLVPWGPSRFIPFDPDKTGVTEKEANGLYRTHVDRIKRKRRTPEEMLRDAFKKEPA